MVPKLLQGTGTLPFPVILAESNHRLSLDTGKVRKHFPKSRTVNSMTTSRDGDFLTGMGRENQQ